MSILPFRTILDDIQEKGLKKALFEVIDDSVERFTAGLNVQDLREALRGEPASRKPNPRLQPHADGFWLHMRPSYFHQDMTGLYPTFRLGWLSTYLVFFETITGIILMFWYTPAPTIAYANMLNILGNVPFGQFVRDLHRLGAEAMVLIVSLHMMRTWLTASYKKPRQFTWFTGVLLLLFTGLLSFTGYLLPWDQLSLWAVTIGASMAEATPVIGQQVNLVVRGAPELGANGLLRFYLAHVLLLPAFLFIFTGVHYYKVIIHGHSLPPQKENIGEDTAKRVPLDKRVYFTPDILTNEIMWIGVTTFIFVVLCIWFYHAPLETHADPQSTPLGTTAPWYFLWIQGWLKLGDKFFWGVLMPTLAIGGLAVLPYLDVAPSRRFKDRRIMITLAMLLISVVTISSYMGLPKFAVKTSADLEILNILDKEPAHNDLGLMRPVPLDQLVPGLYTTRELDAQAGDEANVIAAFEQELKTTVINKDPDTGADITEWNLVTSTLKGAPTAPQFLDTQLPTSIKPMPADAPDFRHVMQEFHDMLEENNVELRNGWGLVFVSQNQNGLKRVDMVISWDSIQLQGANPVFDTQGKTIPITQLVNVFDDKGNKVMIPQLDDKGNPVMQEKKDPKTNLAVRDDQGNTIMEPVMVPQQTKLLDASGNEVPQRRITAAHIFLNQDSQYFLKPGA